LLAQSLGKPWELELFVRVDGAGGQHQYAKDRATRGHSESLLQRVWCANVSSAVATRGGVSRIFTRCAARRNAASSGGQTSTDY
jgi:hypothetical protein